MSDESHPARTLLRVGSLFAGIGGFDLAAHLTGGMRTAWFSELEAYPASVLAARFPGVPNHGDVTLIRGADVEPVDVLVGGFPCQDISLAGKGAGIHGSRSGLWSHYARLIGELGPRWVLAENVAALRKRGLDVVLSDLHALGYDAEWHCIPASAVGAPHQRDRIWILAYPEGAHEERVLGDGFRERLEGHARHGGPAGWPAEAGSVAAAGLPRGGHGAGWWSAEPGVGRVADGVPERVARLRALGNALVPVIPYLIFTEILQLEAIDALITAPAPAPVPAQATEPVSEQWAAFEELFR